MRGVRAGLGVLLALLLLAGEAAAQAEPRFAVATGEGGRVVVQTSGLLNDPALRKALDSGLPLRFHLSVELWSDGFFDHLTDTQDVYLALVQDPIDHALVLDVPATEARYESLEGAERALERALRISMKPAKRGRYYYLATLEVESLSLSDLEELRRWLRGSVQPAVEGKTSPERALKSGLERVLVRVMGLPTRRFEARSSTFRIR